jgi:hypothetical protein
VSNRFDVRHAPSHNDPLRVAKVLLALAALPLVCGVAGLVAPASALMPGGALRALEARR